VTGTMPRRTYNSRVCKQCSNDFLLHESLLFIVSLNTLQTYMKIPVGAKMGSKMIFQAMGLFPSGKIKQTFEQKNLFAAR
jgi:hypothetical protein